MTSASKSPGGRPSQLVKRGTSSSEARRARARCDMRAGSFPGPKNGAAHTNDVARRVQTFSRLQGRPQEPGVLLEFAHDPGEQVDAIGIAQLFDDAAGLSHPLQVGLEAFGQQ